MNSLSSPKPRTATLARRALNAYGDWLILISLLVVVAYLFLLPASQLLFAGRVDLYLGDGGGDPQTLAFQNNVIIQTAHRRPWLLLYGSMYTPQLLAPEGVPMWVPWIERILVPFLDLFVKSAPKLMVIEAWFILTLNGVCFYGLARTLSWPKWLGIVLALCWAFNPYTRARVDAHMVLAATYYLPLLFIGVHRAVASVKSARPRRDIALAATAVFFSMFAAHYYIVITIFLSIPILVYALTVRPARVRIHTALTSLILAALPAVAFLAWNVLKPIPHGLLAEGVSAIPENTQVQILYDLAAHPVDYLGGDVRFGLTDWNPLRERLNHTIWNLHPDSCEPVNGIRWAIIAFAIAGIVQAIVPRLRRGLEPVERKQTLAIGLFTLIAFLLSVPPDFLVVNGEHLGLARFAFKILKNFRCPCRVGPSVHFGALMLAGLSLTRWHRSIAHRWGWTAGAIAAVGWSVLVLGDYMPTRPLLVAPLRAPRPNLEVSGEGCGTGLYAPGAGAWEENTRSQEFYGTSCNIAQYPPGLLQSPDKVTSFLKCAQFSWFVYAGSPSLLDDVCPRLGWTRVAADACRAPHPQPATRNIKQCVD
jgi:hypothetical protein